MPPRLLRCLLIIGFVASGCASPVASNLERIVTVHLPDGSTETSDKPIRTASRQTLRVAELGVSLSNEFPGGAFAAADVDASGALVIDVLPENTPVNDSPWYAFSLRSSGGPLRDVRIVLRYTGGSHRYAPKISYDGLAWTPLPAERVRVAADKRSAVLTLTLAGEASLFVAAQELLDAAAVNRWTVALAGHPFVSRRVYGRSRGGRELVALTIGAAPQSARQHVVVLGRQHPPEATGSMALQHFVETLCSTSALATEFRRSFSVTVLPMLNPDGVDEGHWRHNLGGVDLNRDWEHFRQPETRLARDELLRLTGEPVAFAIDFHSTFGDVFYVLEQPGLAEVWIAALAARMPQYRYRVQPVSAAVPAASNWLAKTFKIPTVTYEVGDETPREQLAEVARAAAEELMKSLLRAAAPH